MPRIQRALLSVSNKGHLEEIQELGIPLIDEDIKSIFSAAALSAVKR